MPKVSVIIPSYNHEKYIGLAIGSVLEQTLQDFEIIICDDGSTDNTVYEIKKFIDKRIKLYTSNKNRGVSAAINTCLRHAKGEYIAHLNSDDLFYPSKLKKQVEYLDTHSQIGGVFSNADLIDEHGVVFPSNKHYHGIMNEYENMNRYKWLNYFFYNCRWLWHPSMMLRKHIYDEIGNHDECLAQIHDFDLGIRFSLQYNLHIIKERLVQFRIRADNRNVSANTIEAQVRSMFEFSQVLKRFLKISSVNDFMKIFPDEKFKHKDIVDNKLIPFYVARAALDVEHVFHQKFALDTIYELFENDSLVKKMEKICNFSYDDFIKLTGTYDFYHLIHLQYQDNKIKKFENKLNEFNSFKGLVKSLTKKILVKLHIL